MTYPIVNSQGKAHRIRVALIVIGFPSSTHPDNGIFNLRAAKALRQSVDVIVVYLRTWKPGRRRVETSSLEGVPVVTVAVPQVPRAGNLNIVLYQCLGWFSVRSLLQTCDLIHSVDAAFAGVVASMWARRSRVHHITQVIGGDINAYLPQMCASRGIAGWETYLHGVACNSRALANAFLGLYPRVRNVRVVYRGVDLDRYSPVGPAAGPLVNRPPVRFLFLGGFPAYPDTPHGANTKGGETLLAAWQGAENNLIATSGSLLIGGPKSNIKRIAHWQASLRNPNQVLLAGHLHPDMVPAYIRSSDAVLIPSMTEGLPNVAMEASACGRPVFGSAIGGISEVIVDGETGLLLPAGNVTAWRDALVAYASRVCRLRVMGQRARHRMEAVFDSGHYTLQMLDLYHAVLCEPLRAD